MDREEWYRKQYEYELDRRTALLRNANVPLGIAGGFGAAAFGALSSLSWPLSLREWLITAGLIYVFMYLFRAFHRLRRAFTAFGSHHVALPNELEKYYRKRVHRHKQHGSTDPAASALIDFSDMMVEQLVEKSSSTGTENDQVASKSHEAKIDLVAVGYWLAATYALVAAGAIFEPAKSDSEALNGERQRRESAEPVRRAE